VAEPIAPLVKLVQAAGKWRSNPLKKLNWRPRISWASKLGLLPVDRRLEFAIGRKWRRKGLETLNQRPEACARNAWIGKMRASGADGSGGAYPRTAWRPNPIAMLVKLVQAAERPGNGAATR
jgi:hypothetical protein